MPLEIPEASAELSVAEGVLLGHVLVSHVADSLGIRIILIKGPLSVMQGLRRTRTSGDVDVLVAPGDLQKLIQALRRRGWRERPGTVDNRVFAQHSITLFQPEWPCFLDIHFCFPGMDKSATECFEVMWDDSAVRKLAGYDVRVPSTALGILLLALHGLRSPHLPSSRAELEYLASVTQRRSLSSDVLRVAVGTGSLAAARPFLENCLPEGALREWPQPSTEWRHRTMASAPGSARLIAVVYAPWRCKPKLIFRAVIPSINDFLDQDMHADVSARGRLKLHMARWARFLRAGPDLVRVLGAGGRPQP